MDNTVGYFLLAAAVVPFGAGVYLSKIGLKDAQQAAQAAKTAAKDLTAAATHAVRLSAGAQDAAAQNAMSSAAVQAANSADSLQSELGGVNDALGSLTGALAPARVAYAISVLLATSALFAFGIISGTAGTPSNGGGTSTPTSTSATTTATTTTTG